MLTFFGLSKDQWELINSFANWFAAVGTLAAVWVSLHLANRIARPSARLSVGHRLLIHPGISGPFPEFVVFRVVNTGDRIVKINQIGWKVGLFRKRFAVQRCDENQSSRLPIELAHGQEASWFVPLAGQDEAWLEYFAKEMLLPHLRTSLCTLRGQAFTSLGHVFEAKPEDNLTKKLREAGRSVQKAVNRALQSDGPRPAGSERA